MFEPDGESCEYSRLDELLRALSGAVDAVVLDHREILGSPDKRDDAVLLCLLFDLSVFGVGSALANCAVWSGGV